MAILDWVFGKSLTPQERLKKNQRALERTQRELERERRKLEVQEKKLVSDIRKSAKDGQVSAAKIQAKDLLRTKKNIAKFNNMRTQLQAITLRIQAVRSSDQMATSMREATGLLASMNRSMNLPQLQRISAEFEKQSDLMDQRQEFMDEAVDDVMGDELEEDEEVDEIVNKVLDEIGVDLNTKFQNTPQEALKQGDVHSHERVAESLTTGSGGTGLQCADDELQARLNSLKR
ncbi:LAME_0G15874g1_1 [Lachancea meyersii CBS 8951]|uniref:LAME_0G15874g1_1 n=1 Tax=Lachancea meyersii CBS 8951 TaxID=1266667 RepID=A0A1G4KB20_9SACH|nr:LAME_0G15874g1_1 [Lachancea meyersii CBS 8951]